MRLTTQLAVAGLLARNVAMAQKKTGTHGEGEMGKSMGPVAFMWPEDRFWDATEDNIAPCGSKAGITNRTSFPLNQGSVALSVADEAWQVAFFISFSENPTQQSDFRQIVPNVTEIDPGHQCYKLETLPTQAQPGRNATVQLQYYSTYENENDGKNQTFYACADIKFVDAKDFNLQVPCFNITSEDFIAPTTAGVPKATPSPGGSSGANAGGNTTPAPSPAASQGGDGGLGGGAKAGIAVGAIAGAALVGAAAFFLMRKRKQGRNAYEMSNRTRKVVDAQSNSSVRD